MAGAPDGGSPRRGRSGIGLGIAALILGMAAGDALERAYESSLGSWALAVKWAVVAAVTGVIYLIGLKVFRPG